MYSSRRSALKQRSVTLKDTVSAAAKDIFHAADNEELPKNPFDYKLEDLQALEKERRSLLTRVKRFSLISISTSFYGTILPDIARSLFSWFNLALYIGIRVVIKMDYLRIGVELPQINTTLVSIVGSFMSFFLVFFVQQAYSRFCVQYDNSMRIEGRLLNLAFFARTNLEPLEAWRFVRYVNAIQVAGYTGLSHIYTESNVFDAMNSKHKLLTDVEVKRVKEIGVNAGGSAYREVLGWCYDLLYAQFRKHREQFDIISFQTMLNELMALRGCIGTLYDYDDQPIPFIYVHLVFFLSMFYCPLIAYTAAVYMPAKSYYIFPDVLGFFVVFLNMVFVIGLREIGHAMNSPYEDSLQDLSVLHYLDFSVGATRKILAGSTMPSPGLDVEEELESTRPDLGGAFVDHSIGAGGPRLNNFHPSSALLHQHSRAPLHPHGVSGPPFVVHPTGASSTSTRSLPDLFASAQFGVYAPYLAGSTPHLAHPPHHPHGDHGDHGDHCAATAAGHQPSHGHAASGGAAAAVTPHVCPEPLHPHALESRLHAPHGDASRSASPTHHHDAVSLVAASGPTHAPSQGGVSHSHSFTQGLGLAHFSSAPHASPARLKGDALDALAGTGTGGDPADAREPGASSLFPTQPPPHHQHIQTSPSTMSLSSLANDSDRDASDKSQAAASDAAAPPATTTTTTTATGATPPVARDDGRRALLVDETAPSPSAPQETRKRRNTRILDSEDSLSLAPDT
eukprot:gene6037-4332_t